jgi:hypothetical protein
MPRCAQPLAVGVSAIAVIHAVDSVGKWTQVGGSRSSVRLL